ncbi:MAG: BMP family ABC transporter substrate-binding protein [Bacteroides sp.]|nr:BMP family ABC transporter substrate-binding protein [Bacteroides sp.]MCM1548732.1 BMP family ABC transporter substrate-binding protein [Clostridium sp.]
MSVQDYLEAMKIGRKEYRSQINKGQYPYLPVLDEILSHVDIEKEVNLGLVQVPLKLVIGTSTRARTNAFAGNFMPILDWGSEFGAKWASLYDSQMEEGIRDPIKAYEYMNRYYVVEGNKRVSVLKYCDAVTVPAMVTRKVPKRTGELENKIYYEFMHFNKLSGVNNIWFSKEGSFPRLLEVLGYGPVHEWTEEEKMDFSSSYLAFSNAYKQKGGKKLPITTGDAFLAFLEIYGYPEAKEMTSGELANAIVKIWKEFRILCSDEVVELRMDPVDTGKKNVLSYLLPANAKKLKVSFVYDKSPNASDWNYGHELGRKYIQELFSNQIETEAVENVTPDENAAAVLEDLIQNGSDIIFTTTSQMVPPSLKAAVEHPEVKILNCSLNTTHQYIRTYYARMYEGKFLTGVIAGSLTENNRIGYVADYPIYGITANINAFALGAKFVNPRAKVYLEWSTLKDHDIYKTFWEQQISYVSNQDMITPENASRQFGLYNINNDEITNLVMPVWNWGIFYEKLLQSIISGSWKKEDDTEGEKALNYWWGMSAGVIDIICSRVLPASTRQLVDLLKDLICKGEFSPFDGEIIAQDGTVKSKANERMQPEEIITMDWLVDNVVGYIPAIGGLKEEAKPVVSMQGVAKSKKEE